MKKIIKCYILSLKEVYSNSKLLFFVYVFTSLLTGILSGLPIILTQKIFDSITQNTTEVTKLVILFIVVKVIYSLIEGISFWSFDWLDYLQEYKFRLKLTKTNLNALDYEDKNILDDIEKSSNTTSDILYYVDSIIYPLFNNIPSIIIVCAYIYSVKPILVLCLLLMFIPAIINQILTAKDYKALQEVVKSEDRRVKTYYSYVTNNKNYKETRVLKANNVFLEKIKFSLKNKTLANIKVNEKTNFNDLITQIFILSGYIIITIMLFISLINEEITIGFFTSIYSAMYTVFGKMEVMTYLLMKNIASNIGKIENYFDFINKISVPIKQDNIDKINKIELNNLNFKYPNISKNSLNNINLQINKGEVIVIVGENGSGKSTLVKLILSLYTPTKGEIKYNNKIGSILDISSCIFQDFGRYGLTVDENITFNSSKNNDKTKLKYVKEKAGLNLKIAGDEMLSKEFGGQDLSGGIWQKIAIARALYKNSEFIVLDEPTSAIDAQEESNLYKVFETLSREKTVIIVTHRMGTVKFADKVLVMDNGELIANGKHDELILNSTKYQQLWNAQAVQYIV